MEVERCDECHFDYDALGAGAVPGALRSLGNRFAMRVSNERGDPTLALTIRTRPSSEIWSALEYACHVRDVFLVQRERVYLTLVEECPSFARMYRDERADLARYAAQEPNEVGRELKMAAEMLAWAFEGLDEAQWQRPLHLQLPRADRADRALARPPLGPRGRAPPARRRRRASVRRGRVGPSLTAVTVTRQHN